MISFALRLLFTLTRGPSIPSLQVGKQVHKGEAIYKDQRMRPWQNPMTLDAVVSIITALMAPGGPRPQDRWPTTDLATPPSSQLVFSCQSRESLHDLPPACIYQLKWLYVLLAKLDFFQKRLGRQIKADFMTIQSEEAEFHLSRWDWMSFSFLF